MLKKISRRIGILLILLSLSIAVLAFGSIYLKRWWWNNAPAHPAVASQAANELSSDDSLTIQPKSKEFGIVIPKLQINAPVTPSVNYLKSSEYDRVLQTGVAHQKGTPTPDEDGNTVIFGHSSAAVGYPKTEYSEIFLLLDKLAAGDLIEIWYQNRLYVYKVKEIRQISAKEINITKNTKDKRLTLYTCWPPGTDLRRLAVTAISN